MMTAQEAYFSDYATYASTLTSQLFQPSSGNTFTVTGTTQSWSATVTNASITTDPKDCTVTVGSGAATDGQIDCT
jgi:hypothetical protein